MVVLEGVWGPGGGGGAWGVLGPLPPFPAKAVAPARPCAYLTRPGGGVRILQWSTSTPGGGGVRLLQDGSLVAVVAGAVVVGACR